MNDERNRPKASSPWGSGESYEPYVGRWSRLVAAEFLRWLSLPAGGRWLDVGSGTGALLGAILRDTSPKKIFGIDRSAEYISYARQTIIDNRVTFRVIDSAEALDFADGTFDAAVSGLVLNFIPRADRAVAEMGRVLVTGGTAGAYLWDYAGKMELMRYFWDAAARLDPAASALDEGKVFPLCRPEALKELFESAGLRNVEVRAIDIPTVFRNFDDYWSPFLGGQGPAPHYLKSLTPGRRDALRSSLRTTLPAADDGSIHLTARAWAVRGEKIA